MPDADANGNPNDDSTPTSVSFSESPGIGVAKRLLGSPLNNGDGTYTLSYRIRAENAGDGPITALQLSDDLAATFAGAVFSVDTVTSNDFNVNPSAT